MTKINNQLGKYLIYVSLLSIAFITMIANISINLYFSNYIKESRSKDDLKVVQYVEKIYTDYNGFNMYALMDIIHYTLGESVTVRLKDMDNNILWNSSTSELITDMGGEFINESSLSYRTYAMNYKDKQIGHVEVGRPKSIISTIEDKQFLTTINIIFAISFVFSVFIAIFLSSRISRKFLKPIYQIIDNTKIIKSGKYKKVKEVNTDTYELNELSISIKELSERLDYQEMLRGRMTSDMAHELRTPLTTLQSHIEAFMDGIWEPNKERLTMLHEEIVRLTKLIKELSDLSIIENDEIKLNKSQNNISLILNNIMKSFKPMLVNKKIDLELDIQNDVELFIDADHFNRIIINIMSNAYKYTKENGTIKVTLNNRNDAIIIIVEDTGIGIPKEDIQYVFERFYRSDISRSRGTGGTGIGLTITKSLIEANNGDIKIESEENKGTKVVCKFPIEY